MTPRLAVGLLLAAVACTPNPSIDGSSVPTIGTPTSPASCTDLCTRLRKLCGYAPTACITDDGGGYCEEQFDTTHRVCVGQAANCKDALDCVNDQPDADVDADVDAATGEGGEDDAATEAAADAKGQ